MTQSFYPLAATPILTADQWSKIARNWLETGVIKSYLNDLLVYADSTGMQVKVKSGAAFLMGHYFESGAEVVQSISTADAVNPRIDRVIVRLDWVANTITLAVLQGTPAVSPAAPALTQNTSRWEISLAQIRVNAGVSTIASTNVTDERNLVKNANAIQNPYTDLVCQNGWAAIGGGFNTPGYLLDEMGFVHLRGSAYNGTTTQGTAITTLPVGLRPKNTLFVSLVTWYGSSAVSSVVYINPDGTITCYSNVGNTNFPFNMIPPFKAEQ